MADTLTVPMAEFKRVADYATELENEKAQNMDPEQRAQYMATRARVAEEALAKIQIDAAKTSLKEKYPEADVEDVTGNTLTEIEASFQRSAARNKSAYERAVAKATTELEERVKGLDEAVQAELKDVLKALGHTRVPPPEETGNDAQAQAQMAEAGIRMGEQTKPTTIEDIAADLTRKAMPRFIREAVAK